MKLQVRLLQIVFALSLTLAIGVLLARADHAAPLQGSPRPVATRRYLLSI